MYVHRKKGFTIVEIMIVVAIIGLLVAIAIPNFVRARRNARKNMCLNNLRLIQYAKEQYALEYNAKQTDIPPVSMIWGKSISYIEEIPLCPEGKEEYVINAIGKKPVCPHVEQYPEHKLD